MWYNRYIRNNSLFLSVQFRVMRSGEMRIAGRELKEFSVCAEADGVCASYAAGQLRHYIKIALGVSLDIVSERRPSRQIVLRAGSGGDGFRGFCSGGSFCLEGDGREGAAVRRVRLSGKVWSAGGFRLPHAVPRSGMRRVHGPRRKGDASPPATLPRGRGMLRRRG